jgi:hypothetical protein
MGEDGLIDCDDDRCGPMRSARASRSAKSLGEIALRSRIEKYISTWLSRLLTSMGVACQVVAPSLIPKAPGDRVKTDRRDCRWLARLNRAPELVPIRVPTEQEEGVRDLCRARADLVEDRTRTRHRLSKFLLRHDQIWRAQAWTMTHERWIASQRFDDPPCNPRSGTGRTGPRAGHRRVPQGRSRRGRGRRQVAGHRRVPQAGGRGRTTGDRHPMSARSVGDRYAT